jgi:hypothetical protein
MGIKSRRLQKVWIAGAAAEPLPQGDSDLTLSMANADFQCLRGLEP